MEVHLPIRTIRLPERGAVMGILNINDDSFSGDGRLETNWAITRAKELIAQGADIIDVGAESARTNRGPIPVEQEIARLEGFLREWPKLLTTVEPRDAEQIWPPVLSINTWRSQVAAAALRQGGELLNDMSGLPNGDNAELCSSHGASLLIMHTMGEPKVSHSHIRWQDLTTKMRDFFNEKIDLALHSGLNPNQIILDPGLGFAKQPEDDRAIIRQLDILLEFGKPILLPVGRKGFIGDTLQIDQPSQRDAGTIGAIVAGREKGAHIFRVHEVSGTFETLKVLAGLKRATEI
ncbi:MAG: dihydropteroate synthase [Verrucomicrobiota bacterium JB023]|nr:dihydropteroate synthase [Verrucomicrobiota bacterium JB023]